LDAFSVFAEETGPRRDPQGGWARRPEHCPRWCRADHTNPRDDNEHAGRHLRDEKVLLLRFDAARTSGPTELWLDGTALGIDSDGYGVSLSPAQALDLASELIAKAAEALDEDPAGSGSRLMEAALYALSAAPLAARRDADR
jgi:hypothetical protein